MKIFNSNEPNDYKNHFLITFILQTLMQILWFLPVVNTRVPTAKNMLTGEYLNYREKSWSIATQWSSETILFILLIAIHVLCALMFIMPIIKNSVMDKKRGFGLPKINAIISVLEFLFLIFSCSDQKRYGGEYSITFCGVFFVVATVAFIVFAFMLSKHSKAFFALKQTESADDAGRIENKESVFDSEKIKTITEKSKKVGNDILDKAKKFINDL